MLCMVCTDVEIEPVLQEITGEELNRGANKAPYNNNNNSNNNSNNSNSYNNSM